MYQKSKKKLVVLFLRVFLRIVSEAMKPLLELYWNFTGTLLELYWNFTGSLLEVYWNGVFCWIYLFAEGQILFNVDSLLPILE